MPLQPSRTVDELRELRELTGDENGAQRVAWTETWRAAKDWLQGKLADVPAEKEVDEAGNEWYTLRGASDKALLIGGHIDSVPNGGWLDGCLNVMAGVEVLRRIAEEGEPPVTVRLVNWADEEGARFGRSLFGSSAAAGSMRDQDELRQLKDRDGIALPDALRELRELTGDENGAQRVAWTETWRTAKDWLQGKLADVPAEKEVDEAGNEWYTLRGASEQALLIGGHIDSVPNGGWLDGCLNVMAGVEVLRRIAEEGEPPVTVRLVNWADEEGARFGRSLFGSSAAAGSMRDQDELRALSDREGVALPDALREHGVDLDGALGAHSQLRNAAAYLELHIEQGPVLEAMDIPLGVVLGTFGVERSRFTWRGQAAHAGSTPMDKRRDALAGAAKLALEIRPIAAEVGEGAVC
ncbi:MAG: M20/M25/M40 family metallo-hydrolase, partial [Gaiellaceae bacterium]